MSSKDRKIGFYNIQFKRYGKKNDALFFDKENLKELLEFINQLSDKERIIKNKQIKKAISIEEIILTSRNDGYLAKIIFKSCKYDHSPQYMSSIDGSERNSDKKNYEGEKEKSHLCMHINNEEAKMVLEERRSGVTIKGVVDYFEQNLKKYFLSIGEKKEYRIIHGIIPVENFDEALKNMKNAKIAEIYTYKKMLCSEGYNLLEREDSFMQEEIVITAKAKRTMGLIKTNLIKAYQSIAAEDSKVTRIRIYGTNSDDNPVKIDSEIIKKLDYVQTSLDTDGTVNTKSIFGQMIKVLEADDE